MGKIKKIDYTDYPKLFVSPREAALLTGMQETRIRKQLHAENPTLPFIMVGSHFKIPLNGLIDWAEQMGKDHAVID